MSSAPTVATVAGSTSTQMLGNRRLREVLGSADWVWFVASGGQPGEDALERLLAAVEPPGMRRASIVSGMPVDEDGRPCEQELAAGGHGGGGVLLELVGQRLLPLRYATFAHCLVAAEAFGRHGLPDTGSFGPHAPVEWSARVLRQEAGYLVPASRVTFRAPAGRTGRGAALRHAGATMRMTRTGAWTRSESLKAFARLVTAS